MKFLFTVLTLLVFSCMASAQTVIPATTTAQDLSTMATGTYRFFSVGTATRDTVDLAIAKYSCPACPVCPTPPPCPVCPPPVKQRTAVGITISRTGQVIVTYDNGQTSAFNLSQSITIK